MNRGWIASVFGTIGAGAHANASRDQPPPALAGLVQRVVAVDRPSPELERAKGDLLDEAIKLAGRSGRRASGVLRPVVEALDNAPGSRGAYLLARYNLGAVLRDAGAFAEAEHEWTVALSDELDLSDISARHAWTVIEFNYAMLLAQRGFAHDDIDSIRRASGLFDTLIDRERDSSTPGTRSRVARALPQRVMLRTYVVPGADRDVAIGAARQAAEEMAAIAEGWGDAHLCDEGAELIQMIDSATGMKDDTDRDADEPVDKEWRDKLHAAALERLQRYKREAIPFLLVLRSFGSVAVAAGAVANVPSVTATMPGISIGSPVEAVAVRWLEQRALVVSVANPGGMALDRADSLARLSLGDDWFKVVQALLLEAEAIVVIATSESPGLRAETGAIEWMARSDDTVLITTKGVRPEFFGSFGHRLAWDGRTSSLARNRDLRALIRRLSKVAELPQDQRLAAKEVARRRRQAAAIAHQQATVSPT